MLSVQLFGLFCAYALAPRGAIDAENRGILNI
jgi:hypothetical protein